MTEAEEWYFTQQVPLWKEGSVIKVLQEIFNEEIEIVREESIRLWTEETDFEVWDITSKKTNDTYRLAMDIYLEEFDLTKEEFIKKLNEEAILFVDLFDHNLHWNSDQGKIFEFITHFRLYAGLLDSLHIDKCFECSKPILGPFDDGPLGTHCEDCTPVVKRDGDFIVEAGDYRNVAAHLEIKGDVIYKTGSTMCMGVDESMNEWSDIGGKVIVEEGVTILDWGRYPDYGVPYPYFNLENKKGPIDVDDIDWDPRSFELYKLEGCMEDRNSARFEHEDVTVWHAGKTKKKVVIDSWG